MKKWSRWSLLLLLSAAIMVLSGCAFMRPPLPTDPSNPLKRIAVLPMKNDTNDVDGPNTVREKMVEELTKHSYVVQDIKETDQILRDQMGINLGGQLDLTTPQKLGAALGVEGVLYGTLMDFDETTTGLYNAKKVRGKFKLVNTATGETFWQRGLGVKSEQGTSGAASGLVRLGARASDAREKEAPWVLLSSTTTNQSTKDSFIMGLGTKLLSKAVGMHLSYESSELARKVLENLAWGPGPGGAPVVAAAPAIKIAMPEIKAPAPPSFGYMDWEGKKDFYAVVHSVSLNKGNSQSMVFDAPLWITGPKMKMEMDMTQMMAAQGAKNPEQSPMSKMTMLNRGDKKTGYTLYPNAQKYMVHTETEDHESEKPRVDKTKVGSETIDGHPCDKYKVTITYKSEKPQEGFIWNARDLGGMTIKSEVENNDFKMTTELRKIVLKASPASTFEIPQGYTEAKSFMEIMMPAGKKEN